MLCSQGLVFPPCSPSFDKDVYTGQAICTTWTIGESQKAFSLVNSPLAKGKLVVLTSAMCKRDMKVCDIDPTSWEPKVKVCNIWRQTVTKCLTTSERAIAEQVVTKRPVNKIQPTTNMMTRPTPAVFVTDNVDKRQACSTTEDSI